MHCIALHQINSHQVFDVCNIFWKMVFCIKVIMANLLVLICAEGHKHTAAWPDWQLFVTSVVLMWRNSEVFGDSTLLCLTQTPFIPWMKMHPFNSEAVALWTAPPQLRGSDCHSFREGGVGLSRRLLFIHSGTPVVERNMCSQKEQSATTEAHAQPWQLLWCSCCLDLLLESSMPGLREGLLKLQTAKPGQSSHWPPGSASLATSMICIETRWTS